MPAERNAGAAVTQTNRVSALAVVPRRPNRPPLRRALLHSVSVSAMIVAASVAPSARAATYRSLGQALASAASAAVRAASNAGGAVAANQAGLGAQNFANAAARFQSLNQALADQTWTGAPVPDGVSPGGLQQAAGVAGGTNSSLWSGASTTLGQTLSNGITDVTVTQTQSVAALTWQTFNIGAHTKLVFNQSSSGTPQSSWIAINTVEDPSENPSTILGEISAPGKVFILNPNGILFGAGSVVDVGSLVAATAQIAQAQLTKSTSGLITGFNLYGSANGTSTSNSFSPTFDMAPDTGSVVVQPGAVIETPYPSGTSGGGYVMLLAATVQNGGAITTPQGQTVLAAGNQFVLQPGYSTSNTLATVIGSEVDAQTLDMITGTGTAALGSVTNTGIVVADQGDITMAGHLVTQAGVLLATTTVDNRGTEHLLTDNGDATSEVVLAPGSVTEILPMELYNVGGTLETILRDPQAAQTGTLVTALDAQRATAIANSAAANAARGNPTGPQLLDANTLADQQGEGRIEISTGGTVDMQGGALALAQGGQVAVGGNSIVLETGSTIDVSGVNTSLAASANSLFIQGIVPYYLRDSAANRTGGLEFQNVYIDERTLVEIATGAYAGNIYTQGGLLEVSGNLGLVGHGIGEWNTLGGQVTLQANSSTSNGTTTGGSVIVAQGSTINLTGGSVTYDAGLVHQSYVQAADGRVFNINDAPGNLYYVGVYNGQTETHPRWRITQTFVNPLLTPAEIMESAYTIGRNAGSLTVSAPTAVLDGTVAAGVTVGTSQTGGQPVAVSGSTIDPFTYAQSVAPLAGALAVGAYQSGGLLSTQFDSRVLLTGSTGGGDAPTMTAPVEAVTGTISIDAGQLSADGLGNITILTAGDLTLLNAVTLADGGTITLGGGTVEVDAGISARGGSIALTNLLPGLTLALGTGTGGITLAAGATLDTSGEWANAGLDPNALVAASHVAGGSVGITSTGGVDLAAGSVIDVTSGGLLTAQGKLTTAAGGSVSISADIVPTEAGSYNPSGNVVLNASIEGYATGAGGTLSISVPEIVLGSLVNGTPQQIGGLNPGAVLALSDNAMFSSGFSNYLLNGYWGLEVDAGRQVAVTRPIYVLNDAASNIATGAATSAAFDVFLPELFSQVKGGDTIAQRAGASLSLVSSIYPTLYNGGGGPVYIDQGAQITVDPKQSITVYGYGQVTDLGTLTAHGGTITIANTRFEQVSTSPAGHDLPINYIDGLSVWIGDGALVDTSGLAVEFTDALGRRFGQAQSGGTILLGGLGGLAGSSGQTTYAQVIVQPGAVLDADGADVTVDVAPGLANGSITQFTSPQTLAGNGGTIGARSLDGVAFDGTLEAAGAGPGAAGGTLEMRIDPQTLDNFFGVPPSLLVPSVILVSEDAVPVQTEAGLAPGSATDPATIGIGRISQQQIDAGGFGTLRLYAQDAILFDGNVALHLANAIYLESGILGETASTASASISAPYVNLTGYSTASTTSADENPSGPTLEATGSAASLTVSADLIDLQYQVDLGGAREVYQPQSNGGTVGNTVHALAYGFADTLLQSSGDIRFDYNSAQVLTVLSSAGDLTLQGAQVYPETGARGAVYAGDNPNAASGVNRLAGGTLTILGQPGAAAAPPLSVGGSLTLVAETIVQDGTLRAPEGVINFGPNVSDPNGGNATYEVTDSVTLGAGSVTSVSLYGETVPYGGTVDGVNYLYNGAAVGSFTPLIQVNTANFTAAAGSQIDLRGGGTLAGAGFIPGRGGTANVNTTPLLNSASGTVVANTSDQVYAIVPSYGSDYAPAAPGDSGYGTPAIGEQITIAAGEVAGLAAGTYTLLPAYYDLLPGAYRVELTGAVAQPGTSTYFGNFTTVAAVTVGFANTSIEGSVPTAALITPAAGVRQLSQFDEETYNTFEANAAATFGGPRVFLPQDAKTLLIELNSPTGTIGANTQPVNIDAGALLQAPAAGGYGATLEITGSVPLEVLGEGDAVTPIVSAGGTNTQVYGLSAAMLDALDLPRLVLGGTLTVNATTPNLAVLGGITPDVAVEGGADLTAADVLITAAGNGTITISSGATVSTLGQGNAPYGLAQGYYFISDYASHSYPVLSLSNDQILFAPNQYTAANSAIVIEDGATLQGGSSGSLNFVAPSGTNVQVGAATLAAAYVDVQVANINVGSQADLTLFAPLLPGGLALTQDVLNTLAQQAKVLTLTAQQEVNLLGNVALNSGNTDLVLNTPAIYGYGVADGAASEPGQVSITAPSFTWGGVSASQAVASATNPTTVSATPGGRISGSAGSATLTGAADLTIDAGTITLGYGPDTQVNDQVQLDRLAVGFATVTLAASTEITANNQNSLSVYATQADVSTAGTGGDLILATPLLTGDSGSILKLTAGGTIAATSGTLTPAATGTVTTLGAEIDLAAQSVAISTAIALPSGKLSITADGSLIDSSSTTMTSNGSTIVATTGTLAGAAIDLLAGADIDLSGRAIPIFDQTVESPGGTLLLQSASGIVTTTATTGTVTTSGGSYVSTTTSVLSASNPDLTEGDDIDMASGAAVHVGAAGAGAGFVSLSALGGTVTLDGALLGAGATTGGSFALAAGVFGTSFDAVNSLLDAGNFSALRSFELVSGDIAVDATVAAHTVDIVADSGSIDVSGTIDAAGTRPGSIFLAASGNVTLESTALLDAHASTTAVDSYGEEIDAENRAHVTLSSTAGTVILNPGAVIDVGYPDAAKHPQGQVVIDAPRASNGGTVNGVAVSAAGSVAITGAQSIDVYAFTFYSPTDANGTIVQDNGTGTGTGSEVVSGTGTIGLLQIDAADAAYMAAVDANGATLAAQMAGLAAYGSRFNLLPGVIISSPAGDPSGGNLTISGDLDFSSLRYSDPMQFGIAVNSAVAGSGEPGSIVFRAANNLTVNGSVSDGFLLPPDDTAATLLPADTAGWSITVGSKGAYEPANADILLPAGAMGVETSGGGLSPYLVLLGSASGKGATQFSTERPISLNYDIVVTPSMLRAGVTIPFTFTIGATSPAIPAGGWVATSAIVRNGVTLYTAGQLIPAGFTFQTGDIIGAGAVLPVQVETGTTAGLAGQLVPAGTMLNVFLSGELGGNFVQTTVILAQDTAVLPVNALIPSNTLMVFGAVFGSGSKAAVQQVDTVDLRPTQMIDGNEVQGYLYPLAQMLPAGDASWSMDFVAGANLAGANLSAVQAQTTLNAGGLAPTVNTVDQAPGSLLIDDEHYYAVNWAQVDNRSYASAVTAFSVIRTGTGDLSLVAGGDVDQSSLYGIYTAGTQDPLGGTQDAQFDQTRQALGPDGLLLPGTKSNPSNAISALISSTYQAYYPNDGGDVLVAAGGDMTGDVLGLGGASSGTSPSDAVGNWLWRQGSTSQGQPTSWWINFGTLVAPLLQDGEYTSTNPLVQLTGFQGIGALGGGNVTVSLGGDAGQMTARDDGGVGADSTGPAIYRGEGLVIAVGSTGRLLPGTTTPVTTGGGDITVTIGGALNPLDATAYGTGATPTGPGTESQAVNGDLIDIRGNIDVTAESIGRIDYVYNSGTSNINDPRASDPFTPNDGVPNGGIVVVPGDGSVSVSTMGDLVLGGAGDPGRVAVQGLTADPASSGGTTGVFTGFTLWQDGTTSLQTNTSIALFSSGGNVTPTSLPNQAYNANDVSNTAATDFRSEYPPTLLVTAATGNIIYGQNHAPPGDYATNQTQTELLNVDYSLETMPSATGQVEFLAGHSIFANGYAVDLSGADPAGLSLPADPAFATISNSGSATNILPGPGTNHSPLALFALEADTPTSDLHVDDPTPARFYAATGDIVNFRSGETLNFVGSAGAGTVLATWYIAAKPVWILAGEDIVSTGNRPLDYPGAAIFALQENQFIVNVSANGAYEYSSGDLFLNNTPADISVISAGRDILSAYAYIAGPGLLEVDAGRNLYQAAYSLGPIQELFFGSFKSLGDNLIPGSSFSTSNGAGIAVLAGVGAAGPDTTAFADLYFNPANQANLAVPITDPSNKGKVQQVYTTQLVAWLAANYGYAGGEDGALAYFLTLPPVDQAIFVRSVFYTELQASGAQEADPSSRFYKTYIRGQQAIDTLFPSTGTEATVGVPAGYTGSITMYSGTVGGIYSVPPNPDATPPTPGTLATFDGGISTLFGGNVQVLDPGGSVEFGIPGGPAPGNSSGIVTYGSGDVDIYALGSVLLGKSRIFTDGGGNIVIWSSEGDINAGIGAKTTISYTPPVLVYDDEGDITQTPPASTSGAGIATLQPLPTVPAGDVNLIAPGGTIDAGEAGIRVSGNLVLAAARVAGTANISVKGSTAGAPTVSVASLGAVEAAGAAAGAASATAQNQGQRNTESRDIASIVDVDVLSIGGSYDDERRKRKRAQQ